MFYLFVFFFFKQKTAYEMRISDWSSDVCSSDLIDLPRLVAEPFHGMCGSAVVEQDRLHHDAGRRRLECGEERSLEGQQFVGAARRTFGEDRHRPCLRDRKSTRLNSSH